MVLSYICCLVYIWMFVVLLICSMWGYYIGFDLDFIRLFSVRKVSVVRLRDDFYKVKEKLKIFEVIFDRIKLN